MATGRVSVSPPNDEPYQSPGASQDDGVDHMMEHYKKLVEQKGEGGERKRSVAGKEGGGAEHGNHSNGALAAVGVPERLPVTVSPKNNHSPARAPTLSPRNGGSATSSHQTSQAHRPVSHSRSSEPEGQAGQAAGGQASQAGLGGDVRSFSWDNLATEPSAGTEGDYYIT